MILKDAEKQYEVSVKNDEASIKKGSDIQKYSVIESVYELEKEGYCVLNNIYVNAGMEESFEARFLNRQSNLTTVDGFKALRVMKAESGPYYVILSLWNSSQDFHNWQDSNQYQNTHKKRGTSSGLDYEVVDRSQSFNVRFQLENE